MRKYTNTVLDFFPTAKSGSAYVELIDITTFTLPDIEFDDAEMEGAGLLGTVNLPNPFAVGDIEIEITGKSYSGMKILFNQDVEVRLNWAEDAVQTGGTTEYIGTTVIAKGRPKSLPGSDIKKGEGKEIKATLGCYYYKLMENGTTMFEINKLTGKLVINGTDISSKLNKALNK